MVLTHTHTPLLALFEIWSVQSHPPLAVGGLSEAIFHDLVLLLLVASGVEPVRNMGVTLIDLLLVVEGLVFEHLHHSLSCFLLVLLYTLDLFLRLGLVFPVKQVLVQSSLC